MADKKWWSSVTFCQYSANGGQLVLALPVDDAAGGPFVAPGHEFNAMEAEAGQAAWCRKTSAISRLAGGSWRGCG